MNAARLLMATVALCAAGCASSEPSIAQSLGNLPAPPGGVASTDQLLILRASTSGVAAYNSTEQAFEQLLLSQIEGQLPASSGGVTTSLSIGTVTAVPYGTAPSASIANGLLSLALEQGAPGQQGLQGVSGTTPTFSVASTVTGAPGTAASVQDNVSGSSHSLTFTVPAGPAGQPGSSASVTSGSIASAGGLLATNNLTDLASPATARTNLGLGSAATASLGTASGNVPVVGANGLLPTSIVPSSGTATVTASSISGAGGLLGSNNLSDVSTPATARTNLGLGSAALATVGTASGNLPALGSGGLLSIGVIPVIPSTQVSGLGSAATANASSFDAAGAATSALASAPLKANNLSDLASVATARTNLGLGSAALLSSGTSSGNVALLGTGGVFPASVIPTLPSTQISGLGTAAAVNTGSTSGTIPLLGSGGLLASAEVPGPTAAQISAAGGALTSALGSAAADNAGTSSGQIPVLGTGGLLALGVIPTIPTSQISGLGTAATVNTGTTSGTIPLLGSGGVLPTAEVPAPTSAQLSSAGGVLSSNNLSDLTSVSAARSNLGLGTAATTASTAYDASGAASTAQAASLQKSSNLSDLAAPATARTNLGLGSAAVVNTGTASGNVPTLPLTASEIPALSYASLASPAFTGAPTAPTQTTGDTSADLSTDLFVYNMLRAAQVSPAFTGTPTAPTQASGDGSTDIATDGFVARAVSGVTGSASSRTLAVGSPYAASARTLCNTEGDAVKVDDYEPVNGPGGTLGTSYGSTLAAVAAYSTTDCNGNTITPFAWMTDGQYSGGLRWTETAGNGQDTVQIGIFTSVFFSGSTSVSTPNTANVPVGAVLFDGTSNSKVGVITSVTAGSGFGISAGAAVGGYAGDTFYILTDTAATAATSTSSATLAVGANFSAPAGTYVYDSTTNALIGTVSSTTSTTGVTLAANAASAVASGDTLAFYSATETLWLEACTRCTYPAGASTRYAKYTDPAYETFYPQVGDTITSSCLPAGTTISAIDTTPTDANYGQITLSQASTTLCAYNASYVISYPDSSMSGLADDWVAFQSAAAAAFSNHTNSYRAITLPDHVLYVNRPLWNATYSGSALQNSDGLNRVSVSGHDGESVIVSQVDLGADKCALSGGWNGALASSSNSIYYHGFSLFGPGVASGAAVTVGNSPSADVGLCLAEGDRADLIDARGFRAGFGIAIGDHQEVNNSSATTNYTAVEFMPGQLTLGNQRFFNDIFVGNYETSFEIAASAQFDSGGVYEVHVGFSPYGWLKDAASPLDPYPGGAGFVTNVVMINNWYEATGNGAWKDLSGQGTLDQDTFIGAQNAFDTQYGGDALPGTAAYAFDVGNFTNNKFIGGNNLSDYGHVTTAMIHVYGNCANNTFNVGPTPITGATATKPFMLCSNNQGGNKFVGGITAMLYKAGAVLTPGQSVTLNSTGLVVAYNGGSYMGALPTGESNSTTGGYNGLTLVNEMVPVVTSGSNITIEDDPNGSSLSGGQAIAPTSDGYYGAGAAGWAGSLGISTASPGAGQTGTAELR